MRYLHSITVSKQTQILDKKGKPVGTQLHLKMAASRALPQTYKCTAGNPVDIVYKDLVVQAPQKSKRGKCFFSSFTFLEMCESLKVKLICQYSAVARGGVAPPPPQQLYGEKKVLID